MGPRITVLAAVLVIVCVPGWSQLRQEVNLSGEWEYVRVSDLDAPPADGWQPIHVPGLIRGVEYERAWFRTDFDIPETMRDSRIVLHFGGVKFNSTVLVNGEKVGGHYGGHEPFDVDITDVAKIGQTNRLELGCHDWTGVFVDNETDFSIMQERPTTSRDIPRDKILAPIGGHNEMFGPWDDVKLTAHPPVHVSDLFIKPSVRDKALKLDLRIGNTAASGKDIALDVQVLDGDAVVLDKRDAALVSAGQGDLVQVSIPWESPRYWTPDDPHLYILRTTLRAGDQVLDDLRTRFGFREFWVDGREFYLNGLRVNLLATSWWPSTTAETREEIQDKIRRIKHGSCICFRTHTQPWREVWYEIADEMGLLMIPEGAVWNDDYAYRIDDPKFWDNYAEHLKAMVDRDKNKPSVVMYSLENEMYGGRLNDNAPAKKDLVRMGELMHEWDPTRPIMYESDGDPSGVADVVGVHYPHEYPNYTKWPNTAYWMDKPQKIGHQFLNGQESFMWDRSKPVYVGEFLWIPSSDPSWHTVFFGDDAYLNYNKYKILAKAESWKMAIQAYRYYEVGGISPWTMVEGGELDEAANPTYAAQKYAMQPVAAYVREYDHNFHAMDEVTRTVDVYNDALSKATLLFSWELTGDGERIGAGEKTLVMQAGERKVHTFTMHMPVVQKRRDVELRLKLRKGGNQLFEDSKAYSIFPLPKLAAPRGKQIALYDPSGGTREKLAGLGLQTSPVADLNAIPPNTEVLVIGAGALKGTQTAEPVIGAQDTQNRGLTAFIRAGGRVLVLEQSEYPVGMLPATLTGHDSTMTFPQMPDHPILAGLRPEDLKWWRPDNIVTAPEPARPQRGAFEAIVVSGSTQGIAHAPLLELPLGQGALVLSQMKIVERLGVEPAAAMLLQNTLNYLSSFRPVARRVALYCPDPATKGVFDEVGLAATDITADPISADWSKIDLLVACGPLDSLTNCAQELGAMLARGGAALLHGVIPREWQVISAELRTRIDLVEQRGPASRIPGAHPLSAFFANEDLYWLGTADAAHSWATKPLSSEMTEYVFTKSLAGKKVSTYPHTMMKVTGAHTSIGEAWADLPSGGSTATVEVDVPADGDYIIGVSAGGTQARGVWPAGAIFADDQPLGTFSCGKGEFETYSVFGTLTAGKHTIAVQFTNDAYNPPQEDRNLRLESVLVAPDTNVDGVAFLTTPAAVAAINVGPGLVVIDNIKWDSAEKHTQKAFRYISGLLTGLGAQFEQPGAAVLEAESFDHDPNMNWYRQDADAAYMGDNGYIMTSARCVKDGRYAMRVVGKGTPVEGTYPIIAVAIDGAQVGEVELRSENWRGYSLEVDLTEGVHEIRLTFINDKAAPGEDRNLYIDRLEFSAAGE